MNEDTPSSDPSRRPRTLLLGIGGVVVVIAVLVGGAVALAVGGDDSNDELHTVDHASHVEDEAHAADNGADGHDGTSDDEVRSADGGDGTDAPAADEEAASPGGGMEQAAPRGGPGPRGGGMHAHAQLPPHQQRYDEASPEEQAAADDLRADVRATLTAFADVDAAVAAGYEAPRNPHSPREHYLNRSVAEEGHVLDPSRPNGLVYYTGGEGDPVLLGAVFVVPPGTEAPTPAGDLVVWHSHNPSCDEFFATEEAPCTDARRMLHVWTVDGFETVARRTGQTVQMQVVDPFGAFGAAFEPA